LKGFVAVVMLGEIAAERDVLFRLCGSEAHYFGQIGNQLSG
jgi:hypothetical protein